MTSSNPEQQTALVTGATGFAGSHLVSLLKQRGYRVVGIARNGGIADDAIAVGDVADYETVRELIAQAEPNVVFHLAAIVDTVSTESEVELHRVNVLGTAAVIEALRSIGSGARLVFTSSAFVYGSTTPDEQPLPEDQPLRPLTPYGASKVAAEALVAQFVAGGGNAVTARAFQHTGPGHTGPYALSDWAEQLARMPTGGSIATGNLEVERDYLDVRDVAAAYLALAELGVTGETYNVCSGRGVTMRALLEGLIAAYGADVEIVTDPDRVRAVDQPTVFGDVGKLQRDTGWKPEFTIEQTLADLAAFWTQRVS